MFNEYSLRDVAQAITLFYEPAFEFYAYYGAALDNIPNGHTRFPSPAELHAYLRRLFFVYLPLYGRAAEES